MNNIVSEEQLAPKVKLFEIKNPRIAKRAQPGQFVMLRFHEKGERIPITIADIDEERGTITLVFNEVGRSTKKLGTFSEGDEILNVAGPLGNPLRIDKFGTVLCIGGGIYAAAMHFVASSLRDAGNEIISVLGGRIKDLLIFRKQLREVSHEFYVCTDDGSEGYKGLGFVKDKILDRSDVDMAVGMGPVAMLASLSEITKPYGIETMASLSPIMVDGTGMCGCCRVLVGGETRFTCIDGPIFNAHEVDWDILESRKRLYSQHEKISLLLHEEIR